MKVMTLELGEGCFRESAINRNVMQRGGGGKA